MKKQRKGLNVVTAPIHGITDHKTIAQLYDTLFKLNSVLSLK